LPGVSLQPGYGDGWSGGSTNIFLESDSAASIARYLPWEGIETRMWWGAGCHAQPAFARCSRQELPVTENLADHVLGLPHFSDLQKAGISLVAETLRKALRSGAAERWSAHQ
jgi:dTDP-4-amino-4,6-dideoxygalactose transaminase